MNTNFFTAIQDLDIKGNLNLTIAKGTDGNLIVSVMLDNSQCSDDAKALIPPLTLKGTASELDEGFFGAVKAPIETASGLMVNMESYMKQLEQAQRQSAMEKEKTDREKKANEEKDRKYTDAMAKADALEKEGKHREAWMKVPNPADYPEHADALRKRKKELSDKFSTPGLFAEQSQEID